MGSGPMLFRVGYRRLITTHHHGTLHNVPFHFYNGLVTHVPLLLFTVIGMLLYDTKKSAVDTNK